MTRFVGQVRLLRMTTFAGQVSFLRMTTLVGQVGLIRMTRWLTHETNRKTLRFVGQDVILRVTTVKR